MSDRASVSILVFSSICFCVRYVYALCLCSFETDHTASDKWVIKTGRQTDKMGCFGFFFSSRKQNAGPM